MTRLLKINLIIKPIFLIFSFLLIYSFQSFSQVSSSIVIQRSKEKVLINGKVYFIHVVKKGQTLYSIAKAYNVTVNDITSVNPDAVTEIRTEQILRIPGTVNNKTETSTEKEDIKITHVVVSGQTLYSIARIYDVNVDEIKKLNPEIKADSISINQVIKIPSLSKPEEEVKKAPSDTGYTIHIVREKETIYSLAKQYGVTQDTLLKINKTVFTEGLKIGQALKIPIINRQTTVVLTDTSKVATIDTSLAVVTVNCDSIKKLHKINSVTISLLLPFFSSGTYESDSETSEENQNEERIHIKQTDEFNSFTSNFIEFYQGFLLAVDDLKKTGLNIKLNVFDTEKSKARLDAIIIDPGLRESDFIIGPVFPEQIKTVSEYAFRNNKFIISPILFNDDVLNNNSYMFLINPGKRYEMKANAYLLYPDTSKNIIVVYNSDVSKPTQYFDFITLLKKRFNADTLNIKQISVTENDFSKVKEAIDSLRENIVISPSTEEIFVTKLLGILESTLIENEVTVIGMREWAYYTGIDLNYFFDLQLSYLSPFYIDYNCSQVKEYLKKYRFFFGTEPVKASKFGFNYSMLGYDIASFFIKAYSSFGKDFTQCLSCVKYNSLVAPFQFVKSSHDGGFINSYLQVVRYNNNYSVERTKIPEK